jgi:hypothetical protein
MKKSLIVLLLIVVVTSTFASCSSPSFKAMLFNDDHRSMHEESYSEVWTDEFELYEPSFEGVFEDSTAEKTYNLTLGNYTYKGEYQYSTKDTFGRHVMHRYLCEDKSYFAIDANTNKVLQLFNEADFKNNEKNFSIEECREVAKKFISDNFPEVNLEIYEEFSEGGNSGLYEFQWFLSWRDSTDFITIRVSTSDKSIVEINGINFGMVGSLGTEKIESLRNSLANNEKIKELALKVFEGFEKEVENSEGFLSNRRVVRYSYSGELYGLCRLENGKTGIVLDFYCYVEDETGTFPLEKRSVIFVVELE